MQDAKQDTEQKIVVSLLVFTLAVNKTKLWLLSGEFLVSVV